MEGRDFCSTAENFGISTQTKKHKRFLPQNTALHRAQDFQEELLRAAELNLQTEMSRGGCNRQPLKLSKDTASSEGRLGIRAEKYMGKSLIAVQGCRKERNT